MVFMFVLKILGRSIKTARENKGFTQEELAEKMNYAAKTNISRFETGDRVPKLETLCLLAEVLDSTPDELLGFVTSIRKASEMEENSVSEKILRELKELKNILNEVEKLILIIR